MLRTRWKTRLTIATVLAALAGSLGLNAVLVGMLMRQYGEEQRLRLDPASAHTYREQNKALEEGDPSLRRRIVLFGDSRILQWQIFPCPSGVEIVNRGVGKETTAQALLRLRQDVFELDPALVVIQTGVNDLKSVGLLPERSEEIERDCLNNIRLIVEAIGAKDIPVVLLTIFPVGDAPISRTLVWSDRTIDLVDRVNQQLRALQGKGLLVLDADRILRDGRRNRPDYSADHLHLNTAGYERLNRAIAPLLRIGLWRNAEHRDAVRAAPERRVHLIGSFDDKAGRPRARSPKRRPAPPRSEGVLLVAARPPAQRANTAQPPRPSGVNGTWVNRRPWLA